VVFSFFKKDPKSGAEQGGSGKTPSQRSPAKPVGRPLAGPVSREPSTTVSKGPPTNSALPDKDFHRTLALETAAKIDAIESEMARDFLRPGGSSTLFPNSAANSTLVRPSQQPVAAPAGAGSAGTAAKPIDLLDVSTDDWNGNANAIELHAEGAGSAIEETAILFANGLIEPAEADCAPRSGRCARRCRAARRLMLFELLQQRGDKAGSTA
jgi:hypothetical protein